MRTLNTTTGIALEQDDLGDLYVRALNPSSADVKAVLDFLKALGWEPVSEDDDDPELLDDGSVRIMFVPVR